MAYRATRTEPRVAVGNFTGDFSKGQIVQIPVSEAGLYDAAEVSAYLVDQGLLIQVDDNAIDNPWFDSDDPDLASAGDGEPTKKGK